MHDAVCPPCTGRCPVFTKGVPLGSLASVGSWSQAISYRSLCYTCWGAMKQQQQAQTSLNLNILDTKSKVILWFPWCLKGECQPGCASDPLLVKHFTKCFVICVGAAGPKPTRCFQGCSVIRATVWPKQLNVVYTVITIIQISKGKAEHFSPSAQCCIKLFFRIALQSDWHVLLLNEIEGEYWEALLCTLAMSRMAGKLLNFPDLKSCSWKSTSSHWNVLLQIDRERNTEIMLRDNSWRKVTMSRPTCWKVETTYHSLMDESRKPWLFTLFLRPSFLNPSL